ncbi:hypothetical protein AKJ16_DCAP10754, partial [Drosera capensis]
MFFCLVDCFSTPRHRLCGQIQIWVCHQPATVASLQWSNTGTPPSPSRYSTGTVPQATARAPSLDLKQASTNLNNFDTFRSTFRHHRCGSATTPPPSFCRAIGDHHSATKLQVLSGRRSFFFTSKIIHVRFGSFEVLSRRESSSSSVLSTTQLARRAVGTLPLSKESLLQDKSPSFSLNGSSNIWFFGSPCYLRSDNLS